jgi:hypothetical protein
MAGAVPDDHLPESLAAHQRKEGPQVFSIPSTTVSW